MARQKAKILETKYFGIFIGIFIFILFALLLWVAKFNLLTSLELKMLDIHFNFKDIRSTTQMTREGVTEEYRDPEISPDLLIVGIDFRTLNSFGKWPFPRYRHADLINSFTRIRQQEDRERAVFIDVFFIEPDEKEPYNDVLLIDSIRQNGNVFLETVLDETPPSSDIEDDYLTRHEILYDNYGKIENITGNWRDMHYFLGLQPPLQPYARATHGYGHANFITDQDNIYRRQPLVAKSSVLLEEMRLEELTPETPLDDKNFERFAWFDMDGRMHNIDYPHTGAVIEKLWHDMDGKAPLKSVDSDEDGVPDESYYVIRKYRDHFVPSITLSLALEYFNKTLDDVEVVLGEYIKIPNPEIFDMETQQWQPYRRVVKPDKFDKEGNLVAAEKTEVLKDLIIPVDENASMLINFMGKPSFSTPGARQTFPVRPYSGYAGRVPGPNPANWPRTKAVGNKILMVGAFARGIAADEKTTPFGLMYGVEIHTNALNTMLMDNFLHSAPWWVDALIMFCMLVIMSLIVSRLSTVWSLVILVVLVFAFFFGVSMIFDSRDYIINFSTTGIGMIFVFISIVVYRIMTEEKDKARIRDMFGKYVSPTVVDQILNNPPELGGVDKSLTVCFSDIRGFTTLSESMTPQELVNHLNEYLTAMTDIILEFNGTLDKYVGDEIMWFFGAPIPQEDHAYLSCVCALKQMEKLNQLNEKWPEERRIDIGIGVNSGIMTVGNMGSMGRMNYTLMGDNVNLGARLEGTNKQYKTNIIISEFTYALVKDRIVARELDNIRVKGKNKPVLIYELIDCLEEVSLESHNGNLEVQPAAT